MRWIKRVAIAVAAVIAALGLAFLGLRYWPRTSPAGQPPMASLSSLDPIRTAFNEEPDRQRLLVLLSPTCPKCVAGASGLGELLGRAAAQNLRTLVVWMPVITTDIAPPTSAKLALIPGAHVRQFWDPGHLVSRQILALGRANLSRLSPEERELVENATVAWDLVALFPAAVKWEQALPWPLLWGFPVEDSLERLTVSLAARW